MNLESATLRSVNYNSPHVQRNESYESTTARPEHDQHSSSEYVSDLSSFDDRVTVIRWRTPPTHSPSPVNGDSASPSHRPRVSPLPAPKKSPTAKTETGSRSPVYVYYDDQAPSATSQQLQYTAGVPDSPEQAMMDIETSPPTPGIDDSPYIRYAINSLTRDAEGDLLKRPDTGASDETYPVERIIPDEGLGYLPPSGGRRSPAREIETEKPIDPVPFKSQVFVPIEPPKDSALLSDLNFKPWPLRPWALGFLIVLSIAQVTGIALCIRYSQRHQGLGDYRGDREGRYFIFEFLPQLLATIIFILILSVDKAIVRMTPFVSLASNSAAMRSSALFIPLFPIRHILPRLEYFRAGHRLAGSCLFVFWLSYFTIPLQSSLFQAELVLIDNRQVWRWVIVQPIAYLLLSLYTLLAIALLVTLLYFLHRRTGLRWDVTSLADLLLLLQRSNSLSDWRSSETFVTERDFRKRLHLRSDRLGYWRIRTTTSDASSPIFYALGESGAPIRTYTMLNGRVMPTITPSNNYQPAVAADSSQYYDLEAGEHPRSRAPGHVGSKKFSSWDPHRYLPFHLRPVPLLLLTLLALSILVVVIVISYTHHALISGFPPLVPTAPNASTGFSPAGFLYSFLPSLLALLLALSHQTLDVRLRALQPFADLSSSRGATAERSLLVDYTARSHLSCFLTALLNRHYIIAFLAINSLLSFALPVLAGGLFWAISFPPSTASRTSREDVRMLANPTTLAFLVVFLILYTLSFPLLLLYRLPDSQTRSLPHATDNLAELISLLYASPLLDDALFYRSSYTGGGGGGLMRGKTEMVTRLLSVAPGELEMARFGLGWGKGRDGRIRWGLGRVKGETGKVTLSVRPVRRP